MAKSYYDRKQTVAPTTTTDATLTTALALDIPDGAIGHVEARVMGRSGSTCAGWRLIATVERPVGGNARMVSSATIDLITPQKDAGASAWLSILDVSSNQARVRVTGVVATNIDWWVAFEVYWGAVTLCHTS